MAILFSQADGSDQHYDTYDEFEQAFVLIKRLNGEKIPQDLLDEVSAKYGDKETKPLQVKIDGNNFESAFRKAVRDVGEELDKLSKDRTPVSDEVVEESAGDDTHKVVALRNGLDVTEGRLYDALGYAAPKSDGIVYITDDAGDRQVIRLGTEVAYVELEDSPTEYRAGDIVRSTEDVVGFGGQYVACNAGELLEVQIGGTGALCLVKDSWKNAYVSENLANIELVCRKEDRKDIEL